MIALASVNWTWAVPALLLVVVVAVVLVATIERGEQ